MADEEIFVLRPESIPENEEAEESAKQEAKALGLVAEPAITLNNLIDKAIYCGGHVLIYGGSLVLIIRIIHMIIPDTWHWLSEASLDRIDYILLGLMSGIATRFASVLNPPRSDGLPR